MDRTKHMNGCKRLCGRADEWMVCIDTWMDGIVHGYRMGCIEVRYDAEMDAWVYVSMSRCLDEKHTWSGIKVHYKRIS